MSTSIFVEKVTVVVHGVVVVWQKARGVRSVSVWCGVGSGLGSGAPQNDVQIVSYIGVVTVGCWVAVFIVIDFVVVVGCWQFIIVDVGDDDMFIMIFV